MQQVDDAAAAAAEAALMIALVMEQLVVQAVRARTQEVASVVTAVVAVRGGCPLPKLAVQSQSTRPVARKAFAGGGPLPEPFQGRAIVGVAQGFEAGDATELQLLPDSSSFEKVPRKLAVVHAQPLALWSEESFPRHSTWP